MPQHLRYENGSYALHSACTAPPRRTYQGGTVPRPPHKQIKLTRKCEITPMSGFIRTKMIGADLSVHAGGFFMIAFCAISHALTIWFGGTETIITDDTER
jgi:hypothetical protein